MNCNAVCVCVCVSSDGDQSRWYLPAGIDSSNQRLGVTGMAVCMWAPLFFCYLWSHLSPELTFRAVGKQLWLPLCEMWHLIYDMSSSNDLKNWKHESVFRFMLLIFCKSVKTEHQQHLALISCGKHRLNTSVPTSSEDKDFPTLGILPFCFTNVPCSAFNKLLMRKMNLNSPVALAVADIFVFVIKGVGLGNVCRACFVPMKQPSIWAGVFSTDKSWQPEQQQIQSKRKQTAREGQDTMKHAAKAAQSKCII